MCTQGAGWPGQVSVGLTLTPILGCQPLLWDFTHPNSATFWQAVLSVLPNCAKYYLVLLYCQHNWYKILSQLHSSSHASSLFLILHTPLLPFSIRFLHLSINLFMSIDHLHLMHLCCVIDLLAAPWWGCRCRGSLCMWNPTRACTPTGAWPIPFSYGLPYFQQVSHQLQQALICATTHLLPVPNIPHSTCPSSIPKLNGCVQECAYSSIEIHSLSRWLLQQQPCILSFCTNIPA